jgi:uncharacterized protein (UPF0335 family)
MTDTNGVAQDQLRSIVERVENLEAERASIKEDIDGVYAEAKGNGYCTKTLRKIIALRKQDANERSEAEAILATYLVALDMAPRFDFQEAAE